MADTKISAMTAATTPLDGTEIAPLVQAGGNVRSAISNIKSYIQTAFDAVYVPLTRTVNSKALSSNITLTPTDISLGSVTNDAQTKAAIVPNTAPSAGQLLAGNAGGTAYAPVSMSGDATLASTGALTIANSSVTLAKIANASTSSKLLGSGASGSGAAYAELTLGTNLSMSGNTLNATGGGGGTPGGSTTQLQYNNAGAFGGTSGITTNGTSTLTFSGISTIYGNNRGSVFGYVPVTESIEGFYGNLLMSSGNILFGDTAASSPIVLNRSAIAEASIFSAGTSAYAAVKARGLIYGSTYTVGTLPTASTVDGGTFYVSDLTSLTNGSTPSGGGSLRGIVKSNGTAYVVLG